MKFLTRSKTNWKIAIIFSALLSAFNLLNNNQYYSETNSISILLSWSATFIFILSSWYIISFLLTFVEKSNRKINHLNKILILVVCTGVLLSIFFLIGIYVRNELNVLATRRENLYFFIALRGFVSIFFIYIFQFALNSDKKAQESNLQNQMLKTENIRAQFEILRQQVNPHFLFNSLSTLRSMIHSNNGDSEMFVVKLSEVYRNLLLRSEKEVTSVKEELDFINDYSYMLFARFKTMLTIDTDVHEKHLNLNLPTFVLQMLLENCIKHNTVSNDHPLKIKIFSTSDCIIIENNLQPKYSHSEHSGYGLKNLEQRYALLGVAGGIAVFTDETTFRVKIKLIEI
ncbi:MAG: histidine kinase [Salinivirgaceae bacterium]|nr:histidine kinase [Salinivirgaceae bacterium]